MPLFRQLAGAVPRSGPHLIIWLLATLLLGAGWLVTFRLIDEDRAQTIAITDNDLVNLGRISQEHAERTFYSADQTLRLVRGQYLEHEGKLDLKSLTEQGLVDSRIFLQVAIIDAKGILLLSNRSFRGRIDLSDHAHFKAHRAPDSDALFISQPMLEPDSGKWTVQLSRRITGKNGEFGGVVVASLDPTYFFRFYSDLMLGNEGVAALYRLDGTLLARKAASLETFVGNVSSGPVVSRIAQGEIIGMLRSRSIVDKIERIYHFRKLPSYPVLLVIGMGRKDVFDNHETTKTRLHWQAAIVSILLLILAAVFSWYFAAKHRHLEAQSRALLQLQNLTNSVPGLVYQYLLRPDGSSCYPFASAGIRDIYRLSPEDVVTDASRIFALIHPDDLAGVLASMKASAQTLTRWVHEYRVSFDDGTVCWLSGNAAPHKQLNGSVLWHGFISDATEHKKAEELLITMSATVEQSPVSIVISDLQGLIRYVNPMFERVSGFTRAEVMGQNPRIWSSGEKSTDDYRELWAELTAGKVWTGEFHNCHKDGTLFWERAVMSPIFDDHGVPIHYVAIKEDITEHKRQTAALIAERARLQALIDAIPDLMFELGLDGRIHAYHSPRTDLLVATPDEFLDKLISDILPPNAAAVGMAALREANERGNSTGMQYALSLPQGEMWFELSVARKATLPNEELRFIVLARDISDRKYADAQLRIAATAFESQEGMCITDASGVILRVNQAYSTITGYSSKEALGKTTRLLSSGRHDAVFYAAMWASIQQNGSWQGEIWNRRKSGEIFPEWLSITAVRDDQAMATHYVATLTDITKRKAAEAEIQHLAFYDPLTGLPNRRLLSDRLKHALAANVRDHHNGALLFIDLDNFKNLNDTHGHGQGDLLLKQVADRLNNCVRKGDTVARLGGDEFVVMLQDLSGNLTEAATQCEAVGQKILAALCIPFQFTHLTHFSSASMGVALIHEGDDSVDELLKRADLALYQAKDAGRNTLRFYDPEMQATMTARAELETDLRHGLQENQFLLYYQPQVDEQGRLMGVEALVRWQHPGRGMVSPAHFIPLAEETGLILSLGQWVLENACRQLKVWSTLPHAAHLTLAVNVSALQFHRENFVHDVLATIDLTGAPASRLKLELTESLLVKDVEGIIDKMLALKARGVGFSLDDFGTGYSSLSYLKRLPLDQLKIDQSFLHEALTHPKDAAIVSAIVALGKSLGMMVIAEGVETQAQRDFLERERCFNYQGYYFGRPAPVEALERFFNQE